MNVDYTVVDQRCKGIAEQDSEHHTLGISRVEQSHDDAEHTDEQTVYPLAGFSLAGSHRVSCHKYGTECESSHYEVHVARDVTDAGKLGESGDCESSRYASDHNLRCRSR